MCKELDLGELGLSLASPKREISESVLSRTFMRDRARWSAHNEWHADASICSTK